MPTVKALGSGWHLPGPSRFWSAGRVATLGPNIQQGIDMQTLLSGIAFFVLILYAMGTGEIGVLIGGAVIIFATIFFVNAGMEARKHRVRKSR